MRVYLPNVEKKDIRPEVLSGEFLVGVGGNLVSTEGIFVIDGTKMKKIVVEKDIVEYVTLNGIDLILDNSKSKVIECNKIPFKHSEVSYDFAEYGLACGNKLIIVSESLIYLELRVDDMSKAELLDILKNLFVCFSR